jgi:two-component system, chemotaxis family, CheB/CheR fusion protein
VLNEQLHVHLWNATATELWGVREDEVRNQPVLHLDIGLPVHHLKDRMRACLRGEDVEEATVLEAHNRRGKAMQCRVRCVPLHGPDQSINGVILVMEEWVEEPASMS